MVTKLFQLLFVPKRARKKLNARTAAPAAGGRQPKGDSGREELLNDVMAVYRQQRQDVYDSLDEATRRQIEEDAEKAFGEALRPKG